MSAGFQLVNTLLGLGGIAADAGFGVAEREKMEELDRKATKLKGDVTEASNLYDHVYYLVTNNLDRFQKAIDQLPTNFAKLVEKELQSGVKESDCEKAINTVARILGYAGAGAGVVSSVVELLIKLRTKWEEIKSSKESPVDPESENHFKDVPVDGDTPVPQEEEGESSIPRSSMLGNLSYGLSIAGAVFSAAGLVTTIGLGAWDLIKLDQALSDIEKKQIQIDKFKSAMTKSLDEIITAAGLPAKKYDDLPALADTWEKISEHFESYAKTLYYAIKGYFLGKSIDAIKAKIEAESDRGMPFPEGGYVLAKTLADDIQLLFKEKKTDQEVVAHFATKNPHLGYRFVISNYFVSSLRPW